MNSPRPSWKKRLYQIIFESDTRAGKAFDVVLLGFILLSVASVMLESVTAIRLRHRSALLLVEWVFTIVFTVEYALRVYCSPRRAGYVFSFFGLIDLLSILPTYLSLFLVGAQYFMIIRVLRLLRVFRIFKLARYLGEAQVLIDALRASRIKVTVFLGAVLTIVVVMGAVMYVVEGEASGFTSIPRSVYWAVVTLTTVGYGDIAPRTPLGQFLATLIMVLGYGIIAVPTGIFSVEMHRASQSRRPPRLCPGCGAAGHDPDARFCKNCAQPLPPG